MKAKGKSKIVNRKSKMDEPLELTSFQQQRANLAKYSQELTADERRLLDFLQLHCQGKTNKVTLALLRDKFYPLRSNTSSALRTLKRIVNHLREKGWKVGASRNSKDPGVFIINSVEELNAWLREALAQVFEDLRIIERMTGRGHYSVRLAGRVVRL